MIREFRQVLAELEMLSHGTTQRIGFSTAGGESDEVLPPGERWPPHITFKWRWECCYSDQGRRDVLRAAESHLREAQGRTKKEPQKPPETPHERKKALIRDGVGLTVYEASVRFSLTGQEVRDARKAEERMIEDGTPNDRLKRAREMKRQEKPYREIVEKTGMSLGAISRLSVDKFAA